jgi:cation diffusion facilitator family transporter
MSEKDPVKESVRVTWIGAATNVALSGLKIFAGVFGNSAALIADGVHSLSDLATDFTVLVSLKLSNLPKDESHPYGHGKIENFSALLIGLILVGVAFGMFFDGVNDLIAGRQNHPTSLALFAAAVSIVVKEGLFRYTLIVGKRTGQVSLIANAWHHRTDALSSIGALVGVSGTMLGAPYFDQVAAVAVALFIVQAGAKIGWDAFADLIDTSLDEKTVAQLKTIVAETPGVKGFHALRSRRVGSQILVDLHIQVPADTTVAQGHRISGRLKNTLKSAHPHIAEVLVHVEPDTRCSLRSCTSLSQVELFHQIKQVVEKQAGVQKEPAIEISSTADGCTASIWLAFDADVSEPDTMKTTAHIKQELTQSLSLLDVTILIK